MYSVIGMQNITLENSVFIEKVFRFLTIFVIQNLTHYSNRDTVIVWPYSFTGNN